MLKKPLSADPQTHPLESFIRETFGDEFASVLLAGYDREAGRGELIVWFSSGAVGEVSTRRSLMVSGELPHGREPLVLAALLKLLLSRVPFSPVLEFEMPEILDSLGWPEAPSTRGEVDRVIRKYLGLSYEVRREEGGEEQGLYALITGYDRDDEIEVGGRAPTRSSLRVHFHRGFIEGLKEFSVAFAGIDFGRLRSGH